MKKGNTNLKRVIVDYNKLNNKILDLLVQKYPYGYGDKDIISFKNAKGDFIECVEVKTDDTIYLVKVSHRLSLAMEDHDDNETPMSDDLGFYDDQFDE